ncbi:MAG: hypothetical protein MK095_01565 [Phycisphaerales bacterium]|nr:hypothetical protein [Phycisphaerales bacterium]
MCTSRSTVLFAAPALLAVLAILAGTPVWTASTGSPRLTAATMVTLGAEARPAVVHMSSGWCLPQRVTHVHDQLSPAHTDRHRIGLLLLVLPPPSA